MLLPDEDFEWFEKTIACCDRMAHGGTLKLIEAITATVASCCFEENAFPKKALEWMDKLQDQLPEHSVLLKPVKSGIANALLQLWALGGYN